jgi:predicted aspartyl protease
MDGVIDHLRRPIVRLEMPPPLDGLLCLIDTGYNGFLLLEQSVALRFQFRMSSRISDQIVLGDGSIRMAEIARGMITWLGSTRMVDAHVVPDARVVRYSSPEQQFDGMIGTALLEGLHVFLDFQDDRVTLRQPPTPG